MQWIRRCKQEETMLANQLGDEDEAAERERLINQFKRKNNDIASRLKA